MTEELPERVATPDPQMNIESVVSTCMNCHQPVTTVKMDAGSEWSPWAHALTAKVECEAVVPAAPPTQRAN